MHIDTVFTQVRRDAQVMLGIFSKKSMKHENEIPCKENWKDLKRMKAKDHRFKKKH
jgi:hypothetical protein